MFFDHFLAYCKSMYINRIACEKKTISNLNVIKSDLPQNQNIIAVAAIGGMTAGTVAKKLCDGVETVKGLCFPSDRLNACSSSEAAVMARTRIRWVKFGQSG